MDAKTLDQRIRDRASEQLHREIDSAVYDIKKMAGEHRWLPVINLAGGVRVDDVLDWINKTIFEAMNPKRQGDAIAEFIAKVDGLQSQVEELRESVEA